MAGALRTGFTTGSCAAAAALAAVRLLLTGVVSHEVEIDLPRGGKAKLKVEGSKLIWVVNSKASAAPNMRSMPLSSHSTHRGP